MDELETLWRAVIENRDDLAPRLVLADALLERGDSRGEIIHLQCDGHPTGRATDADEPSPVYTTANDRQVALRERGHELVASSFATWCPDLVPIVRLPGSWFHEGMLHGVHPQGEPTDWEIHRGHRELVMVRQVRCDATTAPALYATALVCLPTTPAWIDLDTIEMVDALYAARPHPRQWTTKALRLGALRPGQVSATFPDVEHLEHKNPARHLKRIASGEAESIVDWVREARAVFPKLRTIAFSNAWLQIRMTDADRGLAKALRELGVVV